MGSGLLLLAPTPEHICQGQTDQCCRQRRGQAGCQTSQGVKGWGKQLIAQGHEPVHQDRFIKTGCAIDPWREPITTLHHVSCCCGKQGWCLVHQARSAQLAEEQKGRQRHPAAISNHQVREKWVWESGRAGVPERRDRDCPYTEPGEVVVVNPVYSDGLKVIKNKPN